MATSRGRPGRVAALLIGGVVLVACLGLFFRSLDVRYAFDLPHKSKTDIDACAVEKLKRLEPAPKDAFGLLQVSQLCYSELANEQNLGNMEINKIKYLQQNYWDQVILWMVVVITLSGVTLAGVQLLASYNLSVLMGASQLDQQSEFAFEQGKLSVKSSVTGLAILVVSLVFFFVYVKFVYVIDSPKDGHESVAGTVHAPAETAPLDLRGVPDLGVGALGSGEAKKGAPPAKR